MQCTVRFLSSNVMFGIVEIPLSMINLLVWSVTLVDNGYERKLPDSKLYESMKIVQNTEMEMYSIKDSSKEPNLTIC